MEVFEAPAEEGEASLDQQANRLAVVLGTKSFMNEVVSGIHKFLEKVHWNLVNLWRGSPSSLKLIWALVVINEGPPRTRALDHAFDRCGAGR
jgi:hypothetical protein